MTTEATWPIFSLKLKSRSEVAAGTMEFRFDKPAGMAFKAGQFMDLTLIDPPETDAEGNVRGFSINSAPDDPELTFTRAWLALVRGDFNAHSFRSLEKILKQRRNPRLARKLNSEYGS